MIHRNLRCRCVLAAVLSLVSSVGVLVLGTFSTPARAQSLLTGGVSGAVTDASGAIIAGATITLTSLDTGAVQTASSNASGEYRFSLLKPGHYTVTVESPGFEKLERPVEVAVGGSVTANLGLQVGQATSTVEVSAATALVNTDASQITSFSSRQIELLPSAGGDITNITFTAPGVVVNNTGGYGNIVVNGLPATSNLFTVNGENNMDPYFNINNSGASNLTLGQNEIQEASITSNPYSGQFGQLAGAQVSYVTKSGSNEFHGNAQYLWNGRLLNANDFFNNSGGTPTPFANANQWADSIGGPIIHNKMFFFFDNEGLKFLLPNVDVVTAPSPAFASAVLANVQATQPIEAPTYAKMFNLYQATPGYAGAAPLANNDQCNALTLAGFDPSSQTCAVRFQSTPTALASEWILSGRVDYNFSDKDRAYFRYKQDRGTQPTSIDPISANFDALSVQPSWDTQLNETHVFGPRATNSFMATLSYYQALFSQDNAKASSTFPYGIITSSSVPFTGFNEIYEFPQGRNITQYQFIDDYSLIVGRHNLKFGENFRRYDISDHNFFFNSPAVYFGYVDAGLQQYADGLAYQYRQSANASPEVPVALWGLGLYAQDEWNVRPNLKLTLAIRAEHNSNPVCQTNCFADYNTTFNNLATVTAADPTTVPYSSDITTGRHEAFPGVDKINWSPRFGFSYSPGNSGKTVISGGFGLFYDNAPAGLVDDLLENPPASVAIRVRPKAGVLPFDPAGGAAAFAGSASAFNINESYSQIAAALSQYGATFNPPAFDTFVGTLHSPQWQEWNIQLQQSLGNDFAVVLGYVGNHGIKIPYTNSWPNAYDGYGLFPTVSSIAPGPTVPNYGEVTTIQSGAVSSYNGATVTVRKRVSHGLTFNFNYTWSHNLDEISNGGVFAFGDNSLAGQLDPSSLRSLNYGNSDYDIRHNFNGDWVYSPGWKYNNRLVDGLFGGWQWSGKIFWRSGLPFSVIDGNGAFINGGATVLATPVASYSSSCGHSAVNTPCLNSSAFLDSGSDSFEGFSGLSGQNRNQFRGPHYFDVDMQLFKTFKITERISFGLGAQAFNVFNHPNFGTPDNTLGDSTFGQILSMAGTPTSPYGNFLGFDSGPRLVQLTGKITF